MTEPVVDNKSAVVEQLYARITQIAEDMGGTATRTTQSLGFPAAMVPTPRREDAPALHVEMPDTFQVDFAPFLPVERSRKCIVRDSEAHLRRVAKERLDFQLRERRMEGSQSRFGRHYTCLPDRGRTKARRLLAVIAPPTPGGNLARRTARRHRYAHL